MAKKYRLDRVDSTTNGSGLVRFDVWALDDAGEIHSSRTNVCSVALAEVSSDR